MERVKRKRNVSAIREEDPKERSTVLITALGSWEKPVLRGHTMNLCKPENLFQPKQPLLTKIDNLY
jgi:hypothetical protein